MDDRHVLPEGVRSLIRRYRWYGLVALALLAAVLAWQLTLRANTPQALIARAAAAQPERAAALYGRFAQQMPDLAEYAQLWSAQARMPSLEAVEALQAVIHYRPNSPAAYAAHLTLARYYAEIEADQAADAYRAALALDDAAEIRVELARHLEARGDLAGAYAQHRASLGKTRIDAFVDMRSTASDPLVVAQDLYDRYFFTDVVDILRDDQRCEAHCLRAKALSALGLTEQAQAADEACQACLNPEPPVVAAAPPVEQPAEGDAAEEKAAEEEEAAPVVVQEPSLLESTNPVERWSGTWDLDLAEVLAGAPPVTDVLPVYLDVAASGVYVSDDAAYRAWVLAKRRGDAVAEGRARAALDALQPNWYAWRALGRLDLVQAPDFPASAIVETTATRQAKVDALTTIGREDLAIEELRFAGRSSAAPEVIAWATQGLQARGEVYAAYVIAVRHLAEFPYASAAFWRLAYPRAFEEQVVRWATEYQVPPALIWSIMRQESQFAPQVTSSAGAVGLLQLMPANVLDFNEDHDTDYAPGDCYRPEVAIQVGAEHLGGLLRYYEGDTILALMAYNAGAGNVDAWLAEPGNQDRDDLLRFIPFGETREYVGRVGLNLLVYEALYGNDQ